MIIRITQGLRGAITIDSPVWIPSGSKFSMLHTVMQLSKRSRTTSYSTSFQPFKLFHQYLRKRKRKPFLPTRPVPPHCRRNRNPSPQRISGTDDHRIAQLGSSPAGIFGIFHRFALDRLHVDLVEFADEEFAILRIHDCLHRVPSTFTLYFSSTPLW